MKFADKLRNGADKLKEALEEAALCIILVYLWYKVRRFRRMMEKSTAAWARQGV